MWQIAIWVLASAAFAASVQVQVAENSEDFFNLPQCKPVQSFIIGRKYNYQYEAIVENLETRDSNGAKIQCSLEMKILYKCAGTLTFSNCQVSQGQGPADGSLEYNAPPQQRRVTKQMRRYPVYFHFGDGKILKIFAHRGEAADVLNLKRAAISSLQVDFPSFRNTLPNREIVYEESNIFGIGNVTAIVRSLSSGIPRQVVVRRSTSAIKHPYSAGEFGHIHSPVEGSDISRLANELIANAAVKLEKDSTQECEYTLDRGRVVQEVACQERRPASFVAQTYLRPIVEQMFGSMRTEIKVKLNVRQVSDQAMAKEDRMTTAERDNIKASYVAGNVIYEQQWAEIEEGEIINFDPIATLRQMIQSPLDRLMAAKFAKLAHSVAVMPSSDITALWNQISSNFNGKELEFATSLWIQILNRCASLAQWCHLPECEKAITCQVALRNFIAQKSVATWTPEVEAGVLGALVSLNKPTAETVSAALGVAQARVSPASVLALGKVVAKASQQNADSPAIKQAATYIKSLLNEQCNVRSEIAEHEQLMLIAVKVLAVLPTELIGDPSVVVECANNVNAPKPVAMEAVLALKNLKLQAQMREKVGQIFVGNNRPIDLRLACYLHIISNQPSAEELSRIREIVKQRDTPKALKYYIKEHLQSQIKLRGTKYCVLETSIVEQLITQLRRDNWIDVNLNRISNVFEKQFNFRQAIFVPYLNREVNCSVETNLVLPENSIIPLMVNVSVAGEFSKQNISLLQMAIDTTKLLSLLRPLFGNNGAFPQPSLNELLQIPIGQILAQATNQLPPLDAAEISRLGQIQNQAFMAFNMLRSQSDIPITLKVLNTEIDLNRLLQIPFLRNLNVMQLWMLSQKLENGWGVQKILADELLHQHIAIPTSAGVPHVTHTNIAYYLNAKVNVTAQFRSIVMSRRGRIQLMSKPVLRSTLLWSQKVQIPGGVTCGSGYTITLGHNSDVNMSVNVEASQIVVDVAPLPESTEIINLSTNKLQIVNGALIAVQPANECPKSCLFKNCQPNARLQYKACLQHPMQVGLYIESTRPLHYQATFKHGELTARVDNDNVECKGVELQVATKKSLNAQPNPVFLIAAKYLPTLSETRLEYSQDDIRKPWIVIMKSALEKDNQAQTLSYYLASIKVVRPDGSYVTNNELRITKEQAVQSHFFALIHFFSHHSEEANIYTISSTMELPVLGAYSAKGMVKAENNQEPQWTMRVQFNKGLVNENRGPAICHFTVKTEPVVEGSLSGQSTIVTIEPTIQVPIIPYNSIKAKLTTLNDTTGNSKAIVHLEAMRKDLKPTEFINLRFDTVKSTTAAAPFACNATLSCPLWQVQLDLLAPNVTCMDNALRVVVPEKRIPSSLMASNDQGTVRIREMSDTYNPTCITCTTLVSKNERNDVEVRAAFSVSPRRSKIFRWIQPDKTSYYAHVKFLPTRCATCHYIDLKLPYLRLYSNTEKRQGWMEQSKAGVEVHQDLLTYTGLNRGLVRYLQHSLFTEEWLKTGFVLQTTNNVFLVGYHIGERLFSFNGSFQQANRDAMFKTNLTCVRCVPLVSGQFENVIALTHSRIADTELAGYALQNVQGFTQNFRITHNHADVANVSYELTDRAVYNSSLLHTLKINSNLKYRALSLSILSLLIPSTELEIPWSVNVSQNAPTRSDASQYDINLQLGPSMIWEGKYVTAPADPQHHQSLCEAGRKCTKSSLTLKKSTNCANFTVYYGAAGAQQMSYPVTNCAKMIFENVASRRKSNFTALIRGDGDPSFVINSLDLIIEDLGKENKAIANWELSDAPMLFFSPQGNLSWQWNSTKLNVSLQAGEAKFQLSHSLGDKIQTDILIDTESAALDCQMQLPRATPKSTFCFSIPKCALRSQPLTGINTYQSRMNATFNSINDFQLNAVVKDSNQVLVANSSIVASNEEWALRVVGGVPENQIYPLKAVGVIKTNDFDIFLRFNENQMQLAWAPSRTVILMKIPQGVFNTTLLYPANQPLSAGFTFNTRSGIRNQIIYAGGQLQTAIVEAQSVRLPGVYGPCSWQCNYTTTAQAPIDINLQLNIADAVGFQYSYYYGANTPSKPAYQPSAPTNSQLIHTHLSHNIYSEKASLDNVIVLSEDRRSLITAVMDTNSNMWPFRQPKTFMPMEFLCLGEMQMFARYNRIGSGAELNTTFALQDKIDMSMNFTTAPKESENAIFLDGAMAIMFGSRNQANRPTMILTKRLNIVPNSKYQLNVALRTQGYGDNDVIFICENRFAALDDVTAQLQFKRKNTSLRYNFAVANNNAQILFTYPDTRQADFRLDCDVRGDRMTIRDFRIRLGKHLWSAEGATIDLLRGIDNKPSGIDLQNLVLRRTCSCSLGDACHCKMAIMGHARLEIGGECNVDIHDSRRKMIVAKFLLTPGTEVNLEAVTFLNTSLMMLNSTTTGRYSKTLFMNRMDLALEYAHPISGKMMPVMKSQCESRFATEAGVTSGSLTFVNYQWNLWNPTQPIASTLKITSAPNAKYQGKEMSMNLRHNQWVWSHYHIMSDACISNYNLAGLDICKPRNMIMNSTINMPIIKMKIMWNLSENRWHGYDRISLMPMTAYSTARPLFDLHETFDLQWTEQSRMLIGFDNITTECSYPMKVKTALDISMTPTARGNAKTTAVVVQINTATPTVITFSPPINAKGARDLRITKGNDLIFNAQMAIDRCLENAQSSVCIPTAVSFTHVDVNLPVTAILRKIPLLGGIIPDTDMFDLNLQQSAATMGVTSGSGQFVATCHLELNGPSVKNLVLDSTATMTMEQMTFRTTLNRWDAMMVTTIHPATMAFTSDCTMNAPMLILRSKVVCPTMMMPRDVIFRLKTLAELQEMLPIDIDLEYSWATSADTWSIALRSCSVEIPSVLKANVSFAMNSDMRDIALRWNFATESTPILNHLANLRLTHDPPTRSWSLDAMLSNIVCWMKTVVVAAPAMIRVQNVTLGLPNNPQGVEIQRLIDPATQERMLVFSYADRNTIYRCTGRPAASPENTLAFTCIRTEPPTAHKRVIETTVARFQADSSFFLYDLATVNWIKVIRLMATFNYSHLTDQAWLQDTLAQRFHVVDPDLCRRLSAYISEEVNTMRDNICRAWDPQLANQLIEAAFQRMKPYYYYVGKLSPYLKPIGQYLNENYIQFEISNTSDTTTVIMNVTCPRCSKIIASFEIKMTTDSQNRPIATILIRTAMMETSATVLRTFPIRPLGYMLRMLEYDIEATAEYNQQYNLMGMTVTARLGSRGDYRCVAERASPAAMTMPCVCNRMEGETVGPEVAKFNIPILFSEMTKKIYNLATYQTATNLAATIKNQLGVVDEDVSTRIDVYINKVTDYFLKHMINIYANSGLPGSIPVMKLDLSYATVLLSMELPTEELRFGAIIDVTSKTIPDLKQQTRVYVLQEPNNLVLLRVITKNKMFNVVANWNMRTIAFVNASVTLPTSSEIINITASPDGNDYTISFSDVKGSPYQCVLATKNRVTFTCHVMREGARTQVCKAVLPAEMQNLLRVGALATPLVYKAALRPRQFRKYLIKNLNFEFNDVATRDVLCNSISEACLKYINYVDLYAANFIKKNFDHPLAPYTFQALAGTVKSMLVGGNFDFSTSGNIAELAWEVMWQNANAAIRQMENYYEMIQNSLRSISAINISPLVNVENFIEWTDRCIRNLYNAQYTCNLLASEPNRFQQISTPWIAAWSRDLVSALWNLVFYSPGATYYNFWSPELNQVITYRGEYIDLPPLPANSQCAYIYATDPLKNRFSIFAKGQNLILALPGKLIEIATSRTAYVTTAASARQQVNLPYVSDDVICRNAGKVAYCESPLVQIAVKFMENQKIVRKIKFFSNEYRYVVGAIGAYVEMSAPTMFLPNGDEAQNPTELLNAYALSADANCARPTTMSGPVVQSTLSAACVDQVDARMETQKPKQYDAYVQSCSRGLAVTNPMDICLYKEAFNQLLAIKWETPNMRCPKSLRKALYLLLSLSSDAGEMAAAKLARKILIKAKHSNVVYDKIILIAYGGTGAHAEPTMTPLTDMSDSNLRQAIRALQMNGPKYRHDSTEAALRFAERRIRKNENEAAAIVIVAPETVDENLGMANANDLIEDLKGDMATVFLYSRLTEEQCVKQRVNVVLNTGGVCVSKSTRVMVAFVNDSLMSARLPDIEF